MSNCPYYLLSHALPISYLDGLASGLLGVRKYRIWMSEVMNDYSKSTRGCPFYRYATLLRLLHVQDGSQLSHL